MFDHFGFLAPHYEKFIQPKDPQEIREFGQLPTSGALLDAGGGTGRIAQALRGQAGMIVVADLSLRMLEQAQSKDELKLVCSHSERLPFPERFIRTGDYGGRAASCDRSTADCR